MHDDPLNPRWYRRTRAVVFLAFLVALIVGVVVSWQLHLDPPTDRDGGFLRPGKYLQPPASVPDQALPAPASAAGIPPRPEDAVALTVTFVFDGDTIEAADPETDEPTRVRLIGIDTPEGTPTPECWADEARAHLVELLPEGSTVWAAPDTELRDRYDRALLYLWTGDGRFVNYELVAAGDAEVLRIAPNIAHAELLAATRSQAEASRAGRWGACGGGT